ncbi:MAG: HAMP domain-containing protein [Zetaproteobacteria bacterium]|nr:MAG: HAMP domain-containing protein [Zetaproteobacteria bacterium]
MTLRAQLLIWIVPLVALVAAALGAWHWWHFKQTLDHDFALARAQSEREIVNAILIMDAGFRLLEDRLEAEMKRFAPMLLSAYARAGGDPERMDLAALKRRMGPHMDIYAIDQDAVIRHSTDAAAIGFDFKRYGLGDVMRRIMAGDAIANERVRTNVVTGLLGDWIYIPTPDHRHIIEIGYGATPRLSEIAKALDPRKVAKKLEESPYVASVGIYDVFGYAFGHAGEKDYAPTPGVLAHVRRAMREGRFEERDTAGITIWRHVDLASLKPGVSDPSKIVRIRFDTAPFEARLAHAAWMAVWPPVALAGALVLLIGWAARRLTAPVARLAKTAREVKEGARSVRAPVEGPEEVRALDAAFNAMLARIEAHEEELERTIARVRAELAEAEAERRCMRDELWRARLQKERTEIAGGIAHQFNNMLAAMMGHAEILESSPGLSEEARSSAGAIVQTAERARRLVYALVRATGQDLRPPETFSPDAEIRSALAGLQRLAPGRAELALDLRAGGACVHVPRASFREALEELVRNAADATEKNHAPRIAIRTRVVELAASDLSGIEGGERMKPGRHLRLTVADNGCGMGDETLPRIFDPFFTTVPVRAGLGLAMALGVVQSAGGGMKADSSPGRGSSVHMFFPVASGDDSESAAPGRIGCKRAG